MSEIFVLVAIIVTIAVVVPPAAVLSFFITSKLYRFLFGDDLF